MSNAAHNILTLPKGIIQRGNSFRVQVSVNRVRKTATANTLEEALTLQKVLTKELKDTAISTPQNFRPVFTSWTFKEAVEKTYVIAWEGKGGEQASLKNSKQLMAYFGADRRLDTITLDMIDDFVLHCLNEKGNSGATVNRKLACLSRIMRTAHERGKIPALIKMPRRSEGEHRIRFLSKEEEARLVEVLEQCVSIEVHDAVLMLLYTGFRCGELWRLECRDIDFIHNTLTTWKTKNKHPRTIPIVEKLKSIIERRVKSVNGVGKLFPMGSNEWLRRPWAVIRHQMNMDGDSQFVPHMLRHTCATRLSQAGVTMPIIKEWMGHTTITTTARYAHFSPKDLQNAAKLLGG